MSPRVMAAAGPASRTVTCSQRSGVMWRPLKRASRWRACAATARTVAESPSSKCQHTASWYDGRSRWSLHRSVNWTGSGLIPLHRGGVEFADLVPESGAEAAAREGGLCEHRANFLEVAGDGLDAQLGGQFQHRTQLGGGGVEGVFQQAGHGGTGPDLRPGGGDPDTAGVPVGVRSRGGAERGVGVSDMHADVQGEDR